jgi:hypothetical protein
MRQINANSKQWDKNLRTLVFFAIYQSIFNQSIGLDFEIKDYVVFLESISTEYPELFMNKVESNNIDKFEKKSEVVITKIEIESMIVKLASDLSSNMNIFYAESDTITMEIKKYLSDWSKTFGIVKAILYCFLLEKKSSGNSSDFGTKSVGLYIKLAEEFTILANIKLIHAILSKIQS